jgi:hypothetical protein
MFASMFSSAISKNDCVKISRGCKYIGDQNTGHPNTEHQNPGHFHFQFSNGYSHLTTGHNRSKSRPDHFLFTSMDHFYKKEKYFLSL